MTKALAETERLRDHLHKKIKALEMLAKIIADMERIRRQIAKDAI